MVKLVSVYIVLLKVAEPINDVKWRLNCIFVPKNLYLLENTDYITLVIDSINVNNPDKGILEVKFYTFRFVKYFN